VARTTVPASHRDLLDAPVGTLATVGADGLPQLTVVWFVPDGDKLKLSFNAKRTKVRNLRERPEASFLILDPEEPLRYVELRGRIRLEGDSDRTVAARVGAKYGAGDMSGFDAPGDVRVAATLTPLRVHAVDERS
jgi:PPOX class probable F420-dependent enzyme